MADEMLKESDIEWPRYQSHKRVRALKIAKVDGLTIVPEDTRFAPIDVDSVMFIRYTPVAGDYLVLYDDGYKSFSPCEAFEGGYTLIA